MQIPSLSVGAIQHDDYHYFNIDYKNSFLMLQPMAIYGLYQGRHLSLLCGDLFALLFPFIGFTGIRIIGNIFVAFCALKIFKVIEEFTHNKVTSLSCSLFFTLLPGTIFSELLLAAVPFPLGVYFAIESGRVFKFNSLFSKSSLFSVILLTCSFFIYQPVSVMFFFYPFVRYLTSNKPQLLHREAFYRLLIYIFICFFYYVMIKLLSEPYLLKKYPNQAHIVIGTSPYNTDLIGNLISVIERIWKIVKLSNSYILTSFANHFSLLFLIPFILLNYLKSKFFLKALLYSFGIIMLVIILFSIPIIVPKNSLVFYRTTNYASFSLGLIAILSIDKLETLLKKNFNALKVSILFILYLSSMWLVTSSATFTMVEFNLFRHSLINKNSYVPNYDKSINDEFYMPITSIDLAKKRLENE